MRGARDGFMSRLVYLRPEQSGILYLAYRPLPVINEKKKEYYNDYEL